MPKTKAQFSMKRIRKRKASLPVGRLQKIKRFINNLSLRRKLAMLAIGILGVSTLNHYQENGFHYFFKADILQSPAPFNGTVFPVDKVPNWTKWKGSNHTDHFSTIDSTMLIPIPDYDISKLQFPDSDLVWGNTEHDAIRNMKLTYPVVYMGNYEMDYKENAGSHLAVDIRMPVGTPVKSIANGRVIKTSMENGGFGHHIVVQHDNVPSLSDPNKKITLYSAFNHMDEIHVSQGQVVTKGQVIGTSGNTGTTTTPHLHFQIDTASAPWHPYWPFTWEESQQAGLSFFEAVNAGLGQTVAQQNTVNPMLYIKKFLNYSGSNNSNPSQEESEPSSENSPTPEPTPNPNPVDEPKASEPINNESQLDPGLLNFNLDSEKVGFVNSNVIVRASLNSNDLQKLSENDSIEAVISASSQVSKEYFKVADFKNGPVQFNVKAKQAGLVTVEMGKTVQQINFIEEVKPMSSLKIESDGGFSKNVIEELSVVALDANGIPTPVANFFGVISVKAKEGEASFEPEELSSADFKNGVAKVKMIVGSDSRKVVVRAQQGAIVGESDSIYLESKSFSDVSPTHPNYKAIKALEEAGVINGYPDGTFRPDEVVVRVEAVKMLMLAFNVKAGDSTELPFTDTDEEAWYAKTLATAFHESIVGGYPDGTFQPGRIVNIAEFTKMLFETNKIEPVSHLKANPYEDVSVNDWYAGYAYLTNKKNLIDVENNKLKADRGMTRKEVAESIYRLKYILENNLVSYSL